MPKLSLDHLVIAARTLEDAAQYVADSLGVDTQPGGKHVGLGTHNRLLRLSGRMYVELLAIDPDGGVPTRPRLFGMDDPQLQVRLQNGPFLAHWAARVERPLDLTRWQQQYPQRIPPVLDMRRGQLQWRLTAPDDGGLPAFEGIGDGVLPTLIQWDTPTHPADTMPSASLSLRKLTGFHPQPERIAAQLAWLGADTLIAVESSLLGASLVAEIDTPGGVRTLR